MEAEAQIDSGTGILEAVDGPDGEPMMGASEETQEPIEGQAAPDSQETTPSQIPDDDAEVDPLAEAERLMGAFLEEEQAAETDDDDLPAEDEPGGRASNAIRGLRARSQQAEQQLAQFQQQAQSQAQQMQQAFQQQQMENQQLREHLANINGRLEAGPQDPNDPDYLRNQFKEELRAERQQDFEQYAAPLRQELDQFKQMQAQRERETQIQQNSQRYQYMADRAASETLLAGMSDEEAGALNRSELGGLILNRAYATKSDVHSAAKDIKRMAMTYARSVLRSQARMDKERRAASNAAPTPQNSRGNSNARGQGMPTRAQAKEQGFKDELDMMMNQDGLIYGQ